MQIRLDGGEVYSHFLNRRTAQLIAKTVEDEKELLGKCLDELVPIIGVS
jgi:hypothetical protein